MPVMRLPFWPCAARVFQLQLEYYEKIEGKPLTLEGKANQLAEMLRGNLPQAMQGLAVVPILPASTTREALAGYFNLTSLAVDTKNKTMRQVDRGVCMRAR